MYYEKFFQEYWFQNYTFPCDSDSTKLYLALYSFLELKTNSYSFKYGFLKYQW